MNIRINVGYYSNLLQSCGVLAALTGLLDCRFFQGMVKNGVGINLYVKI